MTAQDLNPRARHLLRTLIESYIREGQPVGSRALSRESGLELSPATIRNIMLDLEEMGLVASPHTSAGRVPTLKGYRLFVDALLTLKPLTHHEVSRIQGQLRPESSVEALIGSASTLLSDVTQMAGVVMLPRREHIALRHIEFLSLSDNRVLAIIVINEREVQNRIIHTPRHYSDIELTQISNYLSQAFVGKNLFDVRNKLLNELRETQAHMNQTMHAAITMAEAVFQTPASDPDYVLAGQTNLMGFSQFSDIEKLRQLFSAFNEKNDILHLLDQCMNADGVQIFIGEESGYKVLDECSVVTAPYEVDGQVLGVLGVIGPTRMAYNRVIPIVDITAKLIGAALNQR